MIASQGLCARMESCAAPRLARIMRCGVTRRAAPRALGRGWAAPAGRHDFGGRGSEDGAAASASAAARREGSFTRAGSPFPPAGADRESTASSDGSARSWSVRGRRPVTLPASSQGNARTCRRGAAARVERVTADSGGSAWTVRFQCQHHHGGSVCVCSYSSTQLSLLCCRLALSCRAACHDESKPRTHLRSW